MATASEYTHYAATTPAGYFPLYGPITPASLLMLAHEGNMPEHVTERRQAYADEIGRRLRAGETVATKTATIRPLTAEEYADQG